MIYAIEAVGSGRVKFGRAIDPPNRLGELSTGSPYPLRLLGSAEWPDDHEALIHETFRDFRVCGEWFEIDRDVKRFLEIFSCPITSADDKYVACMKLLFGAAPQKLPRSRALTNAERVKRYRQKRGDAYREENKLRMRAKRKNDG